MTSEHTILEHLAEARSRILAVAAWFLLSFTGSLFGASSLYRFVTSSFPQKLVVLGPDDILWIYVQLASLMALALTVPFAVYHIWTYVRPALTTEEAGVILFYVPATFFCFVGGLAVGFFLISPALLQVLLGMGEGLFAIQLTAKQYLAFVLHTCLPVACIFELPVVVVFLTHLNILRPHILVHYRRYAYFILLVLAVCLTPADLVSDLLMTVPLFVLYEVSIGLSWWIWKKKEK